MQVHEKIGIVISISLLHTTVTLFYISLECPSLPPSVRHGFVNGTGSVEGSLYSFNCKQGYSLVGEKNLYCTEKGRWNASIPICLKGALQSHRLEFDSVIAILIST